MPSIVPNLMVTDMARSVAFYTKGLGCTVTMAVKADRSVDFDGHAHDAVFCTLQLGESTLMLQTAESFAEDVPGAGSAPAATATIYFREVDPDAVIGRLKDAARILKGPELSWYGMREAYLRDPDGYIVCIGMPTGAPPA